MRGLFLLLLVGLFLPLGAAAKPLVADLSQYHIDIDSSFNGTRLLLFGSRNDSGDIVVVVHGPNVNFTVRRKERVAGIWMNHRERHFDDVPSFYIIASSKPLSDIRHSALFKPLHIGLKEAVMKNSKDDPVFAEALIENKQTARLYAEPGKISFMGESLFKLSIPFPDNIPGGNYTADVYLFSDGQLTGMQSIPIHVEKTGFDAWIFALSQTHSVIYGMLSVLIAVGMGWGASSLMQRV